MQEDINFENIKKFFEYNMKIKEEIVKSIPNDNYIDGTYIDRYTKTLDNCLRNMTYYFKMIFNCVGATPDEIDYVMNFINKCREFINQMALSLDDLKSFSKVYIMNMSEELVKKLNSECKGFYIFSSASLMDGRSINEILHILHHRIVNNEYYYTSMPIVDRKGEESKRIILHGDSNDLSKAIFNRMSTAKGICETDILSLNEDKILIMVRGAGHALTIEIEKDKEHDDYMIRYFIPKVTNIELVNMLPGVRKVDTGFRETSGKFLASNEEVVMKVCNFILMVPRDFDSFSYSTLEILNDKKLEISNALEEAMKDEVYFKYLCKKLEILDREIEKLEQKDDMANGGMGGMK